MNRDREIPRLAQPPVMSQPLIDELSRLCFYQHDQVGSVDLLFVFGSNVLQDKLGQLISQADWYKSSQGRALVWGEYLRFETYGRRGDFPIQRVEHTLHTIRLLLS